MATAVKPRIKLDKKEAKKGDLVEVKALVAHIMETGQRKDAQGNTIPRKILKKFACTVAGKQVFAADFEAGGIGEPVHPVQVQGDRVRPRGADLDRRRRLDDRGRRDDNVTYTVVPGARSASPESIPGQATT
jgi:sulfur-oxidizing protein SoxZ